MKLNLIKAESMRKAMNKMHELLGRNALIYRTKHTAFGVEVLAGSGDSEAETSVVDMNEAELAAYSSQPAKRNVDMQLAELSSHIQSLNDKIRLLSRPSSQTTNELTQTCYDTLAQYGFSFAASEAIFAERLKRKKIIPNMSDFIWKTLERVIKITPHELVDQTGTCALVGPTGVGKTTTLVKMAMRFIKRYGADSLGIITTDQDDMTTKNMLTHYCEQLRIDLEYAHSARDLNYSLSNMKHKRLVLIDTFGVSQNDQQAIASLEALFVNCEKKIAIYLALPCQHQEDVIENILSRFHFKGLNGCILTKMDEANNLCPVVTTAIRHECPIAYVCHGQDVEKDIRYPNASFLISKMMMNHDPILSMEEEAPTLPTPSLPTWFLSRGLLL